LAAKLSERYPWVKEVYKNLCDFVHFSYRHIFASFVKFSDTDGSFHIQISAKDAPRPDSDYFEIVEGYYETMRITLIIAAEWHQAMHQIATCERRPG
jgi:hypothetical protein